MTERGATEGLLVVDKPAGWTSHDVVARVRRIAGTLRVGHGGTLDPMATGVLVVGVGRATRLLGHLAAKDKDYDATIRLGVRTSSDDADGDVVETRDASHVSDDDLVAVMQSFVGDIEQVPSSVSAVKVDGERAYRLVRAGHDVTLAPRPVHVARFHVVRRHGDDVDVTVTCSTGTYVRALARDVGGRLGVGAHLTALRRTRVGGFTLAQAVSLDSLDGELPTVSLAEAVAASFPRIDVSEDDARRLVFGQRVDLGPMPAGPHGVFAPDGRVIALGEHQDGRLRTLAVFAAQE